MHRLLFLAGLALLLIASVPRAESALAQTCAPRSEIIAARGSIVMESTLPACDSRGRPVPEDVSLVPNYVSPLDTEYGNRIYHSVGAAPAEPSQAPATGGG